MGTRLHPATLAVSKHLLPIFDRPMIYLPLSTLMSVGLREILIIATPDNLPIFKKLLGDGHRWGIELSYAVQQKPEGIAEALILGEPFLRDSNAVLILGDNIFCGDSMDSHLKNACSRPIGATIFTYPVSDPGSYGIIELGEDLSPISIEEKPTFPKSNLAVTGLYFYDSQAVKLAKGVRPSSRGELEITDINRHYLNSGTLHIERLSEDITWYDAGTPESFLKASQFIAEIEKKKGKKVMCPEEIAYLQKWITNEELENLAIPFLGCPYGEYLFRLARLRT